MHMFAHRWTTAQVSIYIETVLRLTDLGAVVTSLHRDLTRGL